MNLAEYDRNSKRRRLLAPCEFGRGNGGFIDSCRFCGKQILRKGQSRPRICLQCEKKKATPIHDRCKDCREPIVRSNVRKARICQRCKKTREKTKTDATSNASGFPYRLPQNFGSRRIYAVQNWLNYFPQLSMNSGVSAVAASYGYPSVSVTDGVRNANGDSVASHPVSSNLDKIDTDKFSTPEEIVEWLKKRLESLKQGLTQKEKRKENQTPILVPQVNPFEAYQRPIIQLTHNSAPNFLPMSAPYRPTNNLILSIKKELYDSTETIVMPNQIQITPIFIPTNPTTLESNHSFSNHQHEEMEQRQPLSPDTSSSFVSSNENQEQAGNFNSVVHRFHGLSSCNNSMNFRNSEHTQLSSNNEYSSSAITVHNSSYSSVLSDSISSPVSPEQRLHPDGSMTSTSKHSSNYQDNLNHNSTYHQSIGQIPLFIDHHNSHPHLQYLNENLIHHGHDRIITPEESALFSVQCNEIFTTDPLYHNRDHLNVSFPGVARVVDPATSADLDSQRLAVVAEEAALLYNAAFSNNIEKF